MSGRPVARKPSARPAAPPPAPAVESAAPLSRGKRVAFTAAMLLLPLLLLGLAEGALRLAGVGRELPLFVTFEGDPRYRVLNPQVAGRFFYALEDLPNGQNDYFLAAKPADGLRIVVMGESSAAGFPFYYGASFSRLLEQRLQQTFPTKKVEVINTAMAAISSYALRDFVDEVVAIQPDAVLVYAGHNEYYGALGVGSSESLGRSPGFVNLYLRLQRFRVVQALRGLIQKAMSAGNGATSASDGATMMERMVGEQAIPYGSELDLAGERQFRANLGAVLATLRTAGVPTFVGTLASNEGDQPPFISAPATGDPAAWRARVQAATTNPAALATLAREDTLDADVRFALGRALLATDSIGAKDSIGARAAFQAARDRDRLRFRAPTRFNAAIRQMAAASGATVVETEAHLARASPRGIIGHAMMVEHLHPTAAGYFLLADAFYDALRRARVGGDYGPGVSRADAYAERLMTPVDSLVGALRLWQLRSMWPFQPVGVRAPYLDTLRARTPLDSLARALFERRMSWAEVNEAQHAYFMRTGNVAAALRVARAMIQEYPFSEGVHRAAGQTLVEAQRYREAVPYFEAALAAQDTPEGHGALGTLLVALGDTRAAVPHLEVAARGRPNDPSIHYNLAGAYAMLGRWVDAERAAAVAARLAPERQDVRELHAQIAQKRSATGSPR